MYTDIGFLIPKTNLFQVKFDVKDKKLEKDVGGMVLLKEDDVEQCLLLQKEVIEELRKNGKNGFLIERKKEEYEELIKKHITVGYFVQGKLVGQSSVGKCKEDITGHLEGAYDNCKPFEIKGTMVHPGYRKQGISKKMIEFLEKNISSFYEQTGTKCLLIAEIATDNRANICAMSGLGYKKNNSYIAEDGISCTLYTKELNIKDRELSM